MTDKESLTHEIEDDLAARNRNWNKVDRNTTNIAENATNITQNISDFEALSLMFNNSPEVVTNSNGTAFKFPSGLLIFYSDEFTLTYNAGNLLQASHDTPVAFKDTDYFIKPQINIPSNRVGLYQDAVVASSSSYTVRLISSSTSNFVAGNTTKARVFGIGRWK